MRTNEHEHVLEGIPATLALLPKRTFTIFPEPPRMRFMRGVKAMLVWAVLPGAET
jgi:hypothetical protein